MVHLIVYGGSKVLSWGLFAKKCEAKLGLAIALSYFACFGVISYLPMLHNDLSRLFYELFPMLNKGPNRAHVR
jgi:hypothetical protein